MSNNKKTNTPSDEIYYEYKNIEEYIELIYTERFEEHDYINSTDLND